MVWCNVGKARKTDIISDHDFSVFQEKISIFAILCVFIVF